MKFRMKPIEVDAEQWFPGKQIDGVQFNAHDNSYCVKTLEGIRPLNPGDWVVTGAGGERYTFRPEVFAVTFDQAGLPSRRLGRGYCLAIILHWLAKIKPGQRLGIVETGTLRFTDELHHIGDGWSTFYVTDWIKRECPSAFYVSVEENAQTVRMCREFLARVGLDQYVQHWSMNSRELAKMTMPVDLAFLDSSDDPQNQLEEYQALEPNFRLPAFVVLDDVYDVPGGINKGAKTIPYVQGKGHQVERVGRMAMIELGQTGVWENIQQDIQAQQAAEMQLEVQGAV